MSRGLDAFSPEVQAWLLGLGPDPFAMNPDQNSQVIGNWLPPADLDEVGTMDWQNDRLTAQNKANNQFSDFAQIAQLGSSTGGVSPGQFEPFATFEPVKAPGYMTMNYYKASSDPIMKYVAKRLDEGGTALQVENEVRLLIREDPEAAAAMPLITDEMGNDAPDWKRLGGLISTLEQNLINDPGFNAEDPTTGLPANVSYQDTEIAKYFKERDLPNPYETYSPDLLADPGTLKRERENVPFTLNRTTRDAESMLKSMLEQERTAASKAVKERAAQRRSFGATAPSDLPEMPKTLSGMAGASYQQQPRVDRSSGRTGLKRANSAAPHNLPARDSTAFGQAYVAQMKAKQEAEDARFAQLERSRMMAEMTKQGRTPFNDVNRARQGNVYGF